MLDMIITLYHYENNKYTREVIKNCFYYDSVSSNFTKTGIVNTDDLKVVINTGKDIKITEGRDIVVKGICELDFNNSSDETISKSLKELKSKYEAFTVSKVNKNLFGGLSNIELSCK